MATYPHSRKGLLDVLPHHLDVGLVDAQRPGRNAADRVDGGVLEVAVPRPELLQDEHELLRMPYDLAMGLT